MIGHTACAAGAAVEVYPTEHSEGVAVCLTTLPRGIAKRIFHGVEEEGIRFTRPSVARTWADDAVPSRAGAKCHVLAYAIPARLGSPPNIRLAQYKLCCALARLRPR